MSFRLADKIPEMVDAWAAHKNSLKYKEDLFNIHEGQLYDYVDQKLRTFLDPASKTYQFAKTRIAPINLLKKIISKESQIYNEGPTREIYDSEAPSDSELLDWYVEKFDMNTKFDVLNENYNLTKVGFIMPVLIDGQPSLKVIPSHQFLPFNWDKRDPTKLSAIMTYQGSIEVMGNKVELFYAYSNDEFIAFTSQKAIYRERMAELNNPEGVNIYGKIPGVYVKKSRNLLFPLDDTDLKEMVVMIPTLVSDLNLASMFSVFSIFYGIDIDDENLSYGPNVFWKFKSDPTSDKKPEIGTIKPEADIEKTLQLVASQLSMWLNSRGLRPGTIGTVNADNYVSGISKIVDEADATESRNKQAGLFERIESLEFWNLMINYIHPVWVKQGLDTNKLFSQNAKVRVKFPPMDLLRPRAEQIADAKAEVEAGFESRRRAIKKLNPEMSDDEVIELIREIDGESFLEVPANGELATD